MPSPSSRPPEAAGPPTAVWRSRVANSRDAIEVARSELQAVLAQQSISLRGRFRAELVLEEMLLNRLEHAFPDGAVHHTDLSLSIEDEDLVLVFCDDGIPFDPLEAPEPARPATLAQAPVGGLGLLLTRRSARECHYERAAGRNRFTVRIARH